MYNLNRKLTIWTLICSGLICIAAGHGIAPIFLFEVLAPFAGAYYKLKISLDASYDDSILGTALLLLAGHIISLLYFRLGKRLVLITGLSFLWAGVFYLTHKAFSGDNLAMFSLATAFPFLALSVVLTIKLFIPSKSS